MIGEYIAPSIKVIRNVFDQCDELITLAKNAPEDAWSTSAVTESEQYNLAVRNSREILISHSLSAPKMFFELAQAVYTCAIDYAGENGVDFAFMEGMNLLEYAPNQGFFDRHADSGAAAPRSFSALLYLNDVGEGGETWFDKFEIMVKPEKGKLVLFPANYAYSHQAMPPVSGYKYVAVTWFAMKLDLNAVRELYK